MKRKGLFLGLALVLGLGLASCGINEKSAEKINVAAAKEDHFTYAELVDKYGVPGLDANTIILGRYCTWYEDCDTYAEAEKKHNSGKSVDMLVVYFDNDGKAYKAEYSVWEPKED